MTSSTCTVADCSSKRGTRGLCDKHYMRLLRHGSTADPRMPYLTQVIQAGYPDSECWPWPGSIRPDGYARVRIGGKNGPLVYAHRGMYERLVGPIAAGVELDHTCFVRHCVNPAHLEPVDRNENMRRTRGRRRPTHCKRGHEFTADNTLSRIMPSGAESRTCRRCKNEWTVAKRHATG